MNLSELTRVPNPWRIVTCVVLVTLLQILLMQPLLWGEEKGWEKEWRETVAQARKEGRVVLVGSPDPVVRRELTAKFNERFGIVLEYLGVRSGEMVGRIRSERQAGIYSVDVWMGGTITLAGVHYPEKMLDPIKDALILPEILDSSNWKKGKPWLIDPEEKYILRLINYVSGVLTLNTGHVKPGEFKSANDLLSPKWRGKISVYNPAIEGSGANIAAHLYVNLGEEFVKKLYIDQQPAVSRDFRQIADWLAYGKYPVSLGMRDEETERLRKEGISIATLYGFNDLPERVVAGIGNVALMNRAPHPNAARVFVNWIASKEGLETYSRAYGAPTLRKGLDESFLSPQIIPRAGVNYFDASGWDFSTTQEQKVRLRMQELLRK